MAMDKRLARQLRRLNRAIQKLVAQAPEFGELRRMLRDEQVELAIYVVPLLGKQGAGQRERDALRFELTDADRRFLRQAGIKFELGSPEGAG